MPAIIRFAASAAITVGRPPREAPPPVINVPEQNISSLPDTLATDLLESAAAIARFIFGPDAHVRRAHTAMAGKCNPHRQFQLGGRLFTRKTVTLRWIADQERRTSKTLLSGRHPIQG